MNPNKPIIEFNPGPIVEFLNSFIRQMASILEPIADATRPRPEQEVRELRDLTREHNLDLVRRGPAEIERVDGSLVARWESDELTRFKEYTDE